MKTVELWQWWVSDPALAKPRPRKTRYKMSAEAAASTPGIIGPVEGTMELRRVNEPGDPPMSPWLGPPAGVNPPKG